MANEVFQLRRSEATLSAREAEAIINGAGSFRDRLIIMCLYYGGLRVQEVVHLTVGDIEQSRRVLHIRKSKFGKTRTVPFIDDDFLVQLSLFVKGKNNTDLVFGIGRRMIQIIVKKASEKANVVHPYSGARHVNPHLFRHSIARHLKSAGYPAEFIQKFLGHSSIKTTMDTYGTLSLGEMQRIIEMKTKRKELGDGL